MILLRKKTERADDMPLSEEVLQNASLLPSDLLRYKAV